MWPRRRPGEAWGTTDPGAHPHLKHWSIIIIFNFHTWYLSTPHYFQKPTICILFAKKCTSLKKYTTAGSGGSNKYQLWSLSYELCHVYWVFTLKGFNIMYLSMTIKLQHETHKRLHISAQLRKKSNVTTSEQTPLISDKRCLCVSSVATKLSVWWILLALITRLVQKTSQELRMLSRYLSTSVY